VRGRTHRFDKFAWSEFGRTLVRPPGEGQDGPSQSHPLRHLIFESFLRLESLRSSPTKRLDALVSSFKARLTRFTL